MAAPPRFQAIGRQGRDRLRGLEQEHYAIPNILSDAVREIRGMRVHAWRGIGAGYNKFAAESFLDEIAQAKGVDPLALRLELTKDHPRAHAVIKTVAEMADWDRKRDGRALGLAFADYHDSFGAAIAEVSVDRGERQDQGPRVLGRGRSRHRHPAGERPRPARKRRSCTGSARPCSRSSPSRTAPCRQSNFNDYPVLRMSDLPVMHTRLVASGAAPTGMGELSVPQVAPAIANAIFAAHRQAAAAPADVARSGEEGIGVASASSIGAGPRGGAALPAVAASRLPPMAPGGAGAYLRRTMRRNLP